MTSQNDTQTKECRTCGVDRPYDEFPVRKDVPSGRNRQCKSCLNAYNRERRTKLGLNRAHSLKYKYGITEQEYDVMLTAQKGVCCVCSTPPTTKPLHVDHDHNTGRVRGLLCTNCNTGLGQFKDNPELLYKAADYLEEY